MKIDTTKIEGYAEMSAEDKLKALEDFDIEVPKPNNDETDRLKAALSKANSEAAEWKRQFREKQTEQERTEAERAEREAAREQELQTLRRDKTVSRFLAQCLELGYEKDLAQRAAEAMADNDVATILECQHTYISTKTQEIEAKALNKQPTLTPGATPTAHDAEKERLNKDRHYFGLPPLK